MLTVKNSLKTQFSLAGYYWAHTPAQQQAALRRGHSVLVLTILLSFIANSHLLLWPAGLWKAFMRVTFDLNLT